MNTENNKISAEAAEIKDERYLRNRDLILRAQAGDEQASETLIIENTALVKSLALKFRDRGTEFDIRSHSSDDLQKRPIHGRGNISTILFYCFQQ